MERTLAQAKADKIQQLRETAELEHTAIFRQTPGDIPHMSLHYIVFQAILGGGGQITQVWRDKFNQANAIVDKLRTKEAQVNAMTTIQQVDAVVW
jgi:hypothetical protein